MIRVRWQWAGCLCVAFGCGDAEPSVDTQGSSSSSGRDDEESTSGDAGTGGGSSEDSADSTSGAATNEPTSQGPTTTGDSGPSSTNETGASNTTNSGSESSAGPLDTGSSESDPSASSPTESGSISVTGDDASATSETDLGESATSPTTSSTSASAESGPVTTSTDTGGGDLCGNGMLDDGEVCDDGNEVGGDGCEPDCTSSDDVQPLWELEHGGPFGYADCGGGVAFDTEGNLILAGLWADEIWVGKYDTDYALLWEVFYPAVSGLGGCMEVRVAVDAADAVAVIGPQGPSQDVFVAKLDADGGELWTQTFAGDGIAGGVPGDIAFDLEGNVLVAGELTDAMTNMQFWLTKLTPDGDEVWADTHAGPGCCVNGARGVAADTDGNVWAVGYESSGMYLTQVFMQQYDAAGGILDTLVIPSVDGSSGHEIAYDVALDTFGDRIVVGTHRVDAGVDDNDAWVRRYVGGAEAWMTWFEGTGPAEDFALGVALAPDGTIVSAGVMYDAPEDGLRNRWLAKLSEDGTPLWQRRVDESSTDFWVSVAVAADGRIAVAGLSGFAFPWGAEARFAVYPP